ncbi:hypothetical protein OG906_15855 [Streptomyces sp. NBC_01426]|uniref:hypothetical protein n=1 Tax=Streptomyces sp. NBC_01426 TaxID=2975866 RepID=UPI002E34C831|nr:hypothetical protein [Streptomyces sp. NBC_01426]
MGIESDQLVYEYLSRVGDLAQRRQLPSGDRMRLVSGLRDEIDRRRAKYEPETPAAVRRILERIGTPEEVLDTLGTLSRPASASSAAAARPDPAPEPAPAVPTQRTGLRRKAAPPPRPAENVPPHLAGLEELGDGGDAEPDWWRLSPGGPGGFGGPQVEGFAGGIEVPDLFKDPEEDEAPAGAAPHSKQPPGPPESRTRTLVRFLRDRREKRKAAAAEPAPAAEAVAVARPKPHAFLLLAALVLVVGAVTGYWLLLLGGWLLAYASRVLGPTERKAVVFGVPGAVFAGAVVWLWGRGDGRWGDALAGDQMSGVFQDMWPWLARIAGVASALYLAWRARRR